MSKLFIALFLSLWVVACSMPPPKTNQEPLRQGSYLSPPDSKGIRKKLVVTGSQMLLYNDSTKNSINIAYSYRKIDKVLMDFTYTYEKDARGVSLGSKLTKAYQMELKAYPLGAASFYEVKYSKGSWLFSRDYRQLITVSYAAKGIIKSLMLKQAGTQLANSFIERDKYENPVQMVTILGIGVSEIPTNPENVVFTFNNNPQDQLQGGFGASSGLIPGPGVVLENQPDDITRINWIRQD